MKNLGYGEPLSLQALEELPGHPALLQLGEQPLSDGLAQHEELAVLPALSTNVREPKEVERLRLALTPSFSIADRKPPELNQAGLARMKFQTEPLQPLPPVPEESLRVRAILEP